MQRTSTADTGIRPYRPDDHDAVYDICVRTADAGGDARGHYASDDLMPDLFAGPARGFYDRLGFHEIDVPDPGPVTYLGRSTRLPER